MITLPGTLFAALCGLCFGSFLNVCLSRWPEQESIVQPRSHCRHCTHTLSWWENIPLLSWLILRGRCRECRFPIGWRYPLVESTVGILWAMIVFRFLHSLGDLFLTEDLPAQGMAGKILGTLGSLLFVWILTALLFLDAEHLWLPDRLTLGGIVPGFLVTMGIFFLEHGFSLHQPGFFSLLSVHAALWVAGVLAAGGFIVFVRWLYLLLRHREGIGLGDAKLMALLAAWLGGPKTILAFVLAVFLGSLVAVFLLLRPAGAEGRMAVKLPLGSFLCVGGIVSCLWGEPLIRAYMNWAGF